MDQIGQRLRQLLAVRSLFLPLIVCLRYLEVVQFNLVEKALMSGIHPAAGHHLPAFITAPGQTDTLLVLAGLILIAAVLAAGVFFLWLHSLPERMVHNKWQYDFVAVLCLLALFTHIHAFWVAALLLAMIKLPVFSLPDFHSPLQSIAGSLDRLNDTAVERARPTPVAVVAAPVVNVEAKDAEGARKNA